MKRDIVLFGGPKDGIEMSMEIPDNQAFPDGISFQVEYESAGEPYVARYVGGDPWEEDGPLALAYHSSRRRFVELKPGLRPFLT